MRPERVARRERMEAYVCRRYGEPEVVELADVPKPVPNDREVLVKILATTVTSADWRIRTLETPRGLRTIARLALGVARPRQPILGTELAGVVESVGARVRRFAPGDEVFAFPGGKVGCHAQYRAMPEDGAIARKPAKLSFDEAASLPFGGATALHYLRKARLRAGETMLLVGASGGVGTLLLQLAKHQGAEVTAVTSTPNVALVRSLGADHVIDYTAEDALARGSKYDVIVDTVGDTTFARARHALNDGGRLVPIAAGLPDMLAAAWAPIFHGKRVIAGPAEERPEDVRKLAELADAGVLRPVIDRRYEWSQMREAHAYVATRRKRGSVVVAVRHA